MTHREAPGLPVIVNTSPERRFLEAKPRFGRFGFGDNRNLYREIDIDISDAFGNLFAPEAPYYG